MPKPADAKIWNETLVTALKARCEHERQMGRSTYLRWLEGAKAIAAVRGEIYTFNNGRIVGLPKNLKVTVDNEVRAIIKGERPVIPEGYKPTTGEFEFDISSDPYLKKIKCNGGAFAILMAFHFSSTDTMTKAQICEAAQPYCDDAMEANYMAGRSFGAWKSIETLQKRDFVHCNRAGARYEGNAWRSNGCNTYTISDNGKKFTRAMMDKFNIRDDGSGQDPHSVHRQGGGTRFSLSPRRTPPNKGRRALTPGSSAKKSVRADELHATDKRELLEWLEAAKPREKKMFKVGKSRRQMLHDLCGDLMAKYSGLTLDHLSDGVGINRALYITVMRKDCTVSSNDVDVKPAVSSVATAIGKPQKDDAVNFGTVVSPASVTLAPSFAGRGHTLSEGSPTKKMRTDDIPATALAADAALKRQAKYSNSKVVIRRQKGIKMEKKHEPTARRRLVDVMDSDIDSDEDDLLYDLKPAAVSKPKPQNGSRQEQEKPKQELEEPKSKQKVVQLIDDSDDSGDDELLYDLKPTAVPKPKPQIINYQEQEKSKLELKESKPKQEIIELLDDSDEEDEGAIPVEPKANSKIQITHSAKIDKKDKVKDDDEDDNNLGRNQGHKLEAKGSSNEPVELDSQDHIQQFTVNSDADLTEGVVTGSVESQQTTGQSSQSQTVKSKALSNVQLKLTILIDNRERDRNATPRQLRMDLTRHTSTGLLRRVWPSGMPEAQVIERGLAYGDFAFELNKNAFTQRRIPVTIERKRVNDLVSRSLKGDHWVQLQRMCGNCDYAAFLIEGDTGTAGQFLSGMQNLEEWNPDYYVIGDEKGVFLFAGRAILASRKTRFIQTKDEQSSLRAVGAHGLIAALSNVSEKNVASSLFEPKREQTKLADRLVRGGIPWKLVRRIKDEIGSISALDNLYESACEAARDTVLCPIIQHCLPEYTNSVTTAAGWSRAIYRVWKSSLSDAQSARVEFDKHKLIVQDQGRLLQMLHSGKTVEAAIDAALTEPESSRLAPRKVHVELPSQLEHCFPSSGQADEEPFYQLRTSQQNPLGLSMPTLIMQTRAGQFASHRLCVHVAEGATVVESVKEAMAKQPSDFVAAARDAAFELHKQCISPQLRLEQDQQIFLLRGLTAARERVAKEAGYRQELLVVLDMTLADISITYDMVVLQAVKKKVEDLEMVVQQLALACFHYHLLINEIR